MYMAYRTFIRVQLRKSSCDRDWGYFLVYTFNIEKSVSILSIGSQDLAKSLNILFGFRFVNVRAIVLKIYRCRFLVYMFKKTQIDYLYLYLLIS